ncbi:hypothetical protein [Enterococcus mundtii]|uniref:hypothetical protein n=1 Tax=Enterococcus mundtii TaxID=53346 RepID=UPI0035C6697F
MPPVSLQNADWLDTILARKIPICSLPFATMKNVYTYSKVLDEDSGYMLYRVDTDPLLYL